MSLQAPRFSLNHMICPSLSAEALLEAAARLGIKAVELRNDVGENSVRTLESARALGQRARELGIDILSINALYPFNIWNEERAAQAESLAALAAVCGAKGLVLCPLNDGTQVDASAAKSDALREALLALDTILGKYDLKGFVEPLGFPLSSLRFKREAVEAIRDIGAEERFSLVHDTFHHRGANEEEFFPEQTGLVHISGVEDTAISFTDMLDGHRVLVGPNDRLGNLEQLQQLLAGGYQGYISFEPFSEAVWNLADPIGATQESIQYVQSRLAS